MRLPFRHTGNFVLFGSLKDFPPSAGFRHGIFRVRGMVSPRFAKNPAAHSLGDSYQKAYGSGKRRVCDLG